jgi:hypothetical protein
MKTLFVLLFSAALFGQNISNPPSGGSGSGGAGGQWSVASAAYTIGTYYLPPGGGLPASATEANVQGRVGVAGTISNFTAQLPAAPGSGNTVTFTWRDGGVDQAVTCSISGTSATSCADTTHSFAVALADLIDIKMVVAGGSVTTSMVLTWGLPGVAGPAGAAGTSVTPSVESPGVNCATGGVKFVVGASTTYACNGAVGSTGSAGQSVTVTSESAGANCTYGGEKLVSVSGTSYVCNAAPGATGAQGIQGNQGIQGIQGIQGAASTVPGPTGPAGPGVPTGGTTGQVLNKINGTDYNTQWSTIPTVNQVTKEVTFSFDAGSSALTGPLARCNVVTISGTIKEFEMVADATGNATVDVRTVAYASYTGAASASSITASATPAIAVGIKYTDSTLTGWTTSIAKDTVVCVVLTSPASMHWLAGKISIQAN